MVPARGRHGSLGAVYGIGLIYDNGKGVPQDYAEAINWYRKAAERGFPPAESNLGIMYENGKGVAQDYAEAANWYRKAAEQGFPPSPRAIWAASTAGVLVFRRTMSARTSGSSSRPPAATRKQKEIGRSPRKR